MVTKTIRARVARLRSNKSAAQKAPSPARAHKTAVRATLATQPPTSPCSTTNTTVSPHIAPATPPLQRTSQGSQNPSQLPTTNARTQYYSPIHTSTPSQPPTASLASAQTQAHTISSTSIPSQPQAKNLQTQFCPSVSSLVPSQTLSPKANTSSPQAQSPLSTSASTPPQLPIASTTAPQPQFRPPVSQSALSQPLLLSPSTPGLQTQFSSSNLGTISSQLPIASNTAPQTQPCPPILALVPPQPSNASTLSPQTQSCASNPGSISSQTLTASIPTQSGLPTLATTSFQTVPASTASPRVPSSPPVSTPTPPQPTSAQPYLPDPTSTPIQPSTASLPPASVPCTVVQKISKKLEGWSPHVLGLAAIIITLCYGAIQHGDTRWTIRNDFRDGCINDREHELPLSAECVAELEHQRASAVKRQVEANHDAGKDKGLYWAVAICIPVLTCVFHLVWMRKFARDSTRPVISMVRTDRGNCGQRPPVYYPIVQVQHVFSQLNVDEDKGYISPTDEEDYFQAWKDKMKGRPADAEDSESGSGYESSPSPVLDDLTMRSRSGSINSNDVLERSPTDVGDDESDAENSSTIAVEELPTRLEVNNSCTLERGPLDMEDNESEDGSSLPDLEIGKSTTGVEGDESIGDGTRAWWKRRPSSIFNLMKEPL